MNNISSFRISNPEEEKSYAMNIQFKNVIQQTLGLSATSNDLKQVIPEIKISF